MPSSAILCPVPFTPSAIRPLGFALGDDWSSRRSNRRWSLILISTHSIHSEMRCDSPRENDGTSTLSLNTIDFPALTPPT